MYTCTSYDNFSILLALDMQVVSAGASIPHQFVVAYARKLRRKGLPKFGN